MLEFSTKKKARDSGYLPVTESYYMPSEGWMMERVLEDFKGYKVALVGYAPEYKSVWRKKEGVNGKRLVR
jgi:hypothetical protein